MPQSGEDLLRTLLEAQNQNLRSLIEGIKSSSSKGHVSLPIFDPDKPDADPRAWCSTVELCLTDQDLQGGALVMAISRAMKGSASTWLSQVSFAGITWPQFKEQFLVHYDCVETPAATLINLLNDRPKEGECLAAYAARLMTMLTLRWQSLSTEQIAVAMGQATS
ncbi:uncharacterized protein LOC143349782 [Colletes latitarsis]|uniref:uncharacterized protein LOC143349782 n=1 Tax=Colletes latitarsis TaxID=2605962 RepID=UPI0040351AE2